MAQVDVLEQGDTRQDADQDHDHQQLDDGEARPAPAHLASPGDHLEAVAHEPASGSLGGVRDPHVVRPSL